jgi:menaquinone-dependent protoporphyrinogen oxidase
MSRILIVYGTRYGQTERIVQRVKQVLDTTGHTTWAIPVSLLPRGFDLNPYDGVVIAAPIFYGRHQRAIRDFVWRHCEELNRRPSFFISVCGASDAVAQGYIDSLLKLIEWRPVLTQAMTGGLAYTRYNPILRWWMKRIARSKGLPTDTSRDHDFTDWKKVERFAERIAERFEGDRADRKRPPATAYAEGTV